MTGSVPSGCRSARAGSVALIAVSCFGGDAFRVAFLTAGAAFFGAAFFATGAAFLAAGARRVRFDVSSPAGGDADSAGGSAALRCPAVTGLSSAGSVPSPALGGGSAAVVPEGVAEVPGVACSDGGVPGPSAEACGVARSPGVPGSAGEGSTAGRGRGAGGASAVGAGGWKTTVGAARRGRLGVGVSLVAAPAAGSATCGGLNVGRGERLRRALGAGSRRGGSLGGCSCISMERSRGSDPAHDENAVEAAGPIVALPPAGADLYPRAR